MGRNISVEGIVSPLHTSFKDMCIFFLKKSSGLTVLANPWSTQVYVKCDSAMTILTSEIKADFELMLNALWPMKIVILDRSDYEPHF